MTLSKKLFDYQVDDQLEIFLLIKSADEKIARNNKPYLALQLQDTSGEVRAQIWDVSESEVNRYQPGRVVWVQGKREDYNGIPQLRLNKIRLANDSDPSNPELYVKRAPLKKEEMVSRLNDAIFQITNSNLNRIVRHLLNQYQKDFLSAPAAKTNHHAFSGGLAYHTVSMLYLGQAIADYYPNINRSLLYAGLILHDLGKVFELSGPLATEYTVEGNLIGHIVMISEEISKACQQLKIDESLEEVVLLKHVVLSHHGELEYGSPVRPQIKEAEIIHHIDQIDAKLNMLEEALSQTEPGEYTQRLWAMDNRSFYKPILQDYQAATPKK